MKLHLEVVGRGAPELSSFERRYLDRLKYYVDIRIHEVSEGRGKQLGQRLREEEERVLARTGSKFVLFDQTGTLMSSSDWAKYFGAQAQGSKHCFVIGGPDGVSEKMRSAASGCWSLSRLTFPHQLVRLMVLEQFFRAFSILKGHPYHRS
ncbi:MAG: 23S rRNA (pseudouridine(1915)-N(3))-methyltransferase RlmH [Mariprofundaceae bacterium]